MTTGRVSRHWNALKICNDLHTIDHEVERLPSFGMVVGLSPIGIGGI
jgi:hypothetical protein